MTSVGLVGFGEAAQAFVRGWQSLGYGREKPGAISTFDIKIENEAQRDSLLAACVEANVHCAETPTEAFSNKNVIFSLVTADRAFAAAERVAGALSKGALYLDCNSCSPKTKAAAAEVVEGAGGIYIDVAVMSPVHPARHRTPLLVSGSSGELARSPLTDLGMNFDIIGGAVGQASAIKMLRSVMIKGFEALTAECFLAARRAGVEEAVLASLQSSDPGVDWRKRGAYNLERMMVHGKRRAAEMKEVAATLRELGLPDRMSAAATDWQNQIGDLAVRPDQETLEARADLILGYLSH